MKRFVILPFLALVALASHAQRNVINAHNGNGAKLRIETRKVSEINISPDDENVTTQYKDGTTLSWPFPMEERVTFDCLPPRVAHFVQSVENAPVHRFITETHYDPDDYEYTNVLDYADHSIALDEPNPLTISLTNTTLEGGEYALVSRDLQFSDPRSMVFEDGVVKIWNATPGDTLYYKALTADGTQILQEGMLIATGQVRMIYAPSVNNIRDMGGWPVAGGGHVRYGRLYRGAKFHDATNEYLSEEDRLRMRELNIRCEFDMRGGTEAGGGKTSNYYSRLGDDVDYRINGHGMYAYVNAVANYPEYFRYGWNMIKEHIFNGDPIFVHCSHGCDRMGTWAMVIEGVLGVSENDINLDYELSAFAPKSGLWRYRNMHLTNPDYDFRETIGYIKSLPGETLSEKCEYFLVEKCRIPQTDIDKLRQELIVQ